MVYLGSQVIFQNAFLKHVIVNLLWCSLWPQFVGEGLWEPRRFDYLFVDHVLGQNKCRVILFSLKYLVNIKRKRALQLDRSYLSIFIYIFKEHWRNQATKRTAFHQPGNRNKLVFNSVVWKLWWMLCKTVQTECLCSSSRSFSGQKERHFVWNSHEVVCYYIRIGTARSN